MKSSISIILYEYEFNDYIDNKRLYDIIFKFRECIDYCIQMIEDQYTRFANLLLINMLEYKDKLLKIYKTIYPNYYNSNTNREISLHIKLDELITNLYKFNIYQTKETAGNIAYLISYLRVYFKSFASKINECFIIFNDHYTSEWINKCINEIRIISSISANSICACLDILVQCLQKSSKYVIFTENNIQLNTLVNII